MIYSTLVSCAREAGRYRRTQLCSLNTPLPVMEEGGGGGLLPWIGNRVGCWCNTWYTVIRCLVFSPLMRGKPPASVVLLCYACVATLCGTGLIGLIWCSPTC